MPDWTLEHGFDRLQEYKTIIAAAEGKNEAATRLLAIDTMLFEVLGWDRVTVEPEKYCREEGFADYVFQDGTGFGMVLEAKKADATFVICSNKLPVEPVGFALLAKECPAAERAMLQALGYAASLGSRYISITNGFQWLISLTFVSNTIVTDRSVLAFESISAVEEKFRLFWECFSPAGVAANSVHGLLMDSRKSPPPTKLSQRLTNYPSPATRNKISNELSVVLGAVWEEIRYEEEEEEFLKACYVEPDTAAASMALAKEMLDQHLSTEERLFSSAVDPKQAAEFLKTGLPEKPIVVLGKVGHGKTTFLHYLRKIKAKATLEKYIQIDINFLDQPDRAADVAEYVYVQVEEQLRDKYKTEIDDNSFVRAALHSDLSRFKKTPEAKAFESDSVEYRREELAFIKAIRSNKAHYMKRVFAHIRSGRKQSVAIFFDNLDRRPQDIQEEAYLKASAIARDWAAMVFVCLRPNTFQHSKRFGVLDSVAPKIIVVNSPRTGPVVARRIKYAKRYAEGEIIPKRAPFSQEYSFRMPSVAKFLECLAESFRRNAKLCDLFGAISNGNTREMLTYVYNCVISMHLDSQEILDHLERDGKYIIPDHHALRAILYGDSMHYDPERSVFINLFDLQQTNPLQHFSRHLVLHYLIGIPESHPAYGFCSLKDVVRYLCQQSLEESHVVWTIRYLFERKLIESRDPIEEWRNEMSDLRITTLGKYHETILLNQFTYVDAMAIDTPILKDDARTAIMDVFNINDRLKRAKNFVDYLNACSSAITGSAPKAVWLAAHTQVLDSIKNIESSVNRG